MLLIFFLNIQFFILLNLMSLPKALKIQLKPLCKGAALASRIFRGLNAVVPKAGFKTPIGSMVEYLRG